MRNGFIRVGVATPSLKVASPSYNSQQTIGLMNQADKEDLALVVFPELGLTSYTAGDLILQSTLIQGALQELLVIVEASKSVEVISVVGLPLLHRQKLYNCAAVIHKGEILGIIPKTYISDYQEYQESRYYQKAPQEHTTVMINDKRIPFGTKLLFQSKHVHSFTFAVEICADMWAPSTPSTTHALHGATIIANLSASNELIGKKELRRSLVTNLSYKTISGYLFASSGIGESTTDAVFGGHNLIVEHGNLLAESPFPFEGLISSEIDTEYLLHKRALISLFASSEDQEYHTIVFDQPPKETSLTRVIESHPFVPSHNKEQELETALTIQSLGLVKRLQHLSMKKIVIGISGGLDSTLAALVAVRAFTTLKLPLSGIIGITMPCFGTSKRTYENSHRLAKLLGITLKEIDITESVRLHFKDIGHDPKLLNATYENAQARERTQVLMDIANSEDALVLGTGDLSELALGWATYNGDHMSMYAVNTSVAKTLIPHLIRHEAGILQDDELRELLEDIIATPVSPELLPDSQETEKLIGPYELHDFFLYRMVERGDSPTKIVRVAEHAFKGSYTKETIVQYLTLFYKRFFSQQFKRSALPDGPKVGVVSLSPRGIWNMASDSDVSLWLEELKALS
ncbi:MAG: NAD(+) synthase [Sphaerochaetaceae bacterium]